MGGDPIGRQTPPPRNIQLWGTSHPDWSDCISEAIRIPGGKIPPCSDFLRASNSVQPVHNPSSAYSLPDLGLPLACPLSTPSPILIASSGYRQATLSPPLAYPSPALGLSSTSTQLELNPPTAFP